MSADDVSKYGSLGGVDVVGFFVRKGRYESFGGVFVFGVVRNDDALSNDADDGKKATEGGTEC